MKSRLHSAAAFTLVEVMTSMVILTVLLLFLHTTLDQTMAINRSTTSKAEQFRSARDGFESLTRRLSQATLNTYWDYDVAPKQGGQTNINPGKYRRKSELRFVSGSGAELTAVSPPAANAFRLGHAVFFQGCFGYSTNPDFQGLGNLLNTSGYYLEFNSDLSHRPPFLAQANIMPERYRYRLMETLQPSEELDVYRVNPLLEKDFRWIKSALRRTTGTGEVPRSFVRAENVIALVLLPKLSPKEDPTGVRLAPGYGYDSTKTNADPSIDSFHQLPPLIEATMVAIDEPSAIRIHSGSTPPQLGLDDLFKAGPQSGGASASNYKIDLETLEKNLTEHKPPVTYRIFTTTVSMRAAKWSRE